MAEDEIPNLVARAQRGDDDAFTALYDVFSPRVYRFFRFRVTAADAAEDLTQRVFVKMIEQLPKYERRGIPFAAWVFKVARNAWIDEGRSTHPSVPLDSLATRATDAEGPDGLVAAAEDSDELRAAIATLPPDQREVIACRFFADLSPEETAAQMDRSEGSVRVLQHRALARLRNRLSRRESARRVEPEVSVE